MDKVALVTGANRGIGYETAHQLLQKGFKVILTSRKKEDGEQAVSRLKDYKDQVYFHQLDVTDPGSIEILIEDLNRDFGRLDVLINNAGINYDTWQNELNADMQTVEETLNTNLLGPWRMVQAIVPLMKQNGYGRVVNVSSGAGALNTMKAGTPAYGISKAALNVLTIKLADTLQGTGILVNAVCPGWVRTDMGGSNATRSVEQGAETIVWLADLPNDGESGKFFRDKKVIPF